MTTPGRQAAIESLTDDERAALNRVIGPDARGAYRQAEDVWAAARAYERVLAEQPREAAIEAALRELLASLRQDCGVESAMALADAALAEQPRLYPVRARADQGGGLMDANGNIYRAPEDEIPPEDRARYDGYLKGKAENELEVSRLLLQVATEREQHAQAARERMEALAERDAAEARETAPHTEDAA